MRKTSFYYFNKSNDYRQIYQGGEKKVMRKSLSMLLAIAMVFSMFSSLAFAADATKAPTTVQEKYDALAAKGIFQGMTDGSAGLDQPMDRAQFARVAALLLGLEGISIDPKVDDTKIVTVKPFKDVELGKWYTEEIAAVKEDGKFVGNADGTFNPSGNITIQELAIVVAKLLGLEVVADAKVEGAANWAAGSIQALINAKIPFPTNYKEDALRSDLVTLTFAAYTAIEGAKAPVNATKVVSVTASNLAQVVIAFDGKVEKATAGDSDNYSINNSIAVKSASVSDDAKSVTLTLTTATPFTNQVEYKLSFNNVKSGTAVLSVTDYKFTPVDSTLPVVEKAEALGNKTIKVTFSEPVKVANASSFMIDEKILVGNTNIVGNTVFVKSFSALTNGEHKINVKGVEDFATFKSLSADFTVTVVEDTTAPTISEVVNATFESVTLKFSEPVDPATVFGSNVYWVQGSTKFYADSSYVQEDDSTFKFTFSGANKLQYATDLYVLNVKDYSGNAIAADTKVAVTPVIDTTRPEVITAAIDDARKVITIKFNKTLDQPNAEKPANYVIKDADAKVVSSLKTAALQPDGKTVKVTLAAALSEGKTYTLEISGVTDSTVLKNSILPYSKTLAIGDKTGPNSALIAAEAVSSNNTVVVSFPEAMSTSGDGSVVDRTKYLYSKVGDAGPWLEIPSSTNMNITSDGKSAILAFNLSDVNVNDVKGIQISLVKDVAGNYITGLTTAKTVGAAVAATLVTAKATATDKIKLTFDKDILGTSVAINDFRIANASGVVLNVISATTDGKDVILTLSNNTKLSEDAWYTTAVTASVVTGATTSTAAGKAIAAGTKPVTDSIAATIDTITGSVYGTTLTITFNEKIAATVTNSTYTSDLLIKNDDKTLIPSTDYNVSATGTDNVLTVTFVGSANPQRGILSVAIINPRFLVDANLNVVAASDARQVQGDSSVATTTFTSGSSTSIVLGFGEAISTVSVSDTVAAGNASSAHTTDATSTTIAISGAAVIGETVTVTYTDKAGNSKTNVATYNGGVTWTIS
jgi:hypothetical protein